MSKYEPLTAFLKGKAADHIAVTFAEVERVLGFKLPASAYAHPAWWANDTGKSHVQAQAWLSAGYETEQINSKAKKLVFKRAAKLPLGTMEETHREYRTGEKMAEKKLGRHPALGSMKGTFTIEPGWDLTRPALDPEEWAEWEASLDRKADMLAKVFSKNKQ